MDFIYFLIAWGIIGVAIGLLAIRISRKLPQQES